MNSNSSLSNTILVVYAAIRGANAAITVRIAAPLRRFLRDGYGTTALEYALIAAITAMVAVVGMVSVGGGANASIHLLDNAVQPVMAPGNNAPPSGNAAPSPKAPPGSACTTNCGSTTVTVP